MSSVQPRRARAMLNTMLVNRQITPQGLDWLTLATDPFHDTEISPTGFPDADSSRSIPQMYQYTGVVAAPAGLATPTWDCHVTFCPVSSIYGGGGGSITSMNRCTLSRDGTLTGSANNYGFFGGYNVVGVPGGTNVITGTPASLSSTSDPLYYPSAASSGQFRLVACGVEVVNTTPELYRGGSVTCYRSPNSQVTGRYISSVPSTVPCEYISAPPGSTVEAQLYPATRTWGAEDGCYLVGTLDASSNDYKTAVPNAVVATQPLSPSALLTGAGTSYAFASNLVLAGSSTNCNTPLPFDWHGAIFSGLNPNSTLQVSVRYYVERIPTITQPELLVLTRDPTPYDPVALEIYSRAMSQLPVGVRVSENPLGEWFNDIMDMVGTWAPRIGAGLGSFIPGGAAIGTAVGAGASALSKLNRPDKSVTNKQPPNSGKQRKPQQQQQQQQKSTSTRRSRSRKPNSPPQKPEQRASRSRSRRRVS